LYRVKQELPKKNIDHNVLQKRGSGKSPWFSFSFFKWRLKSQILL
jgi:hypothetical protein